MDINQSYDDQRTRKYQAEDSLQAGIPFKVEKFIQTVESKNTRVGDADKKEYFLQWKIKKIDAKNVIIIELPDTHGRKNIIPDNEDNGNQNYRRKKILPFLIEPDPGMKGIDKRNNDGEKVDE